MEAIKYQLLNARDNSPLPTIYTAFVKPGETFETQSSVQLRRCKSMIIEDGDWKGQPRKIEKCRDGKWRLYYGFPRGKSWSQGCLLLPIHVIEIITNDKVMERETLKQIAGYYFKEQTGMEPDSLRFTYQEDGIQEYNLQAEVGDRTFDIWMLPLHNRIRLTEIRNESTFKEAAQIAGHEL